MKVLLINGWAATSKLWQPVLDGVHAEYGLHIEVFANPGFDANAPWQGQDVYVASLQTYIEACDQSLCLVGWSLGGMLAMELAAANPKKVKKLCLVAALPKFVAADDWTYAMPLPQFEIFVSSLARHAQKALLRFRSLQVEGITNKKEFLQHFNRLNGDSLLFDDAALLSGLQLLGELDIRVDWSKIRADVSVLLGGCDSLANSDVASWYRTRDCTVTVWPEAGHIPFLENPEQFVSWLYAAITQVHVK